MEEELTDRMPCAQLEFILPHEMVARKQVLHPYSMKDATQAIDENRGTAYFVPHGFQPILVPLEGEDATLQALLEWSTPVMPVSVPLKQTLLPHYIIKPTKRHKATKQASTKGPPRPPNAFILYRKNQQAHILRQNANLCNNDVSRIIGSMWNGESPAVKQQFHMLAQKMKEQHRAMYPMYRYSPKKSRRKRQTPGTVNHPTPGMWTKTALDNKWDVSGLMGLIETHGYNGTTNMVHANNGAMETNIVDSTIIEMDGVNGGCGVSDGGITRILDANEMQGELVAPAQDDVSLPVELVTQQLWI